MLQLQTQLSATFAEQFVTNFYRLITTYEMSFIPLYYSLNIFSFYISDQLLTNQMIFSPAGLSDTQQTNLYDDPLYGWGK